MNGNLAAKRAGAIGFALLTTACGSGAEPAAPEAVAARPACALRVFEGSRFTVCPIVAGRDRVELAVAGADGAPLRSFAALERTLAGRAREVRFAVNAGMYDGAGRPVGLHVERGRTLKPLNVRRGPGNFHLLPNGVFAVDRDGRMAVVESRRFRRRAAAAWTATQSGPMLVVGGRLHPRFDADGPSRLIRNGVGVRGPGLAFAAIAEEPVSFGRFARLFRDGLGCPDALFLDGSVSSLWDPGAGRMDPHPALGPMLVVFAGRQEGAAGASSQPN